MAQAAGWYAAPPIFAGLLGLGAILANLKWGVRRWWGLILALVPSAIGSLMLLIQVLFTAFGTGTDYFFWLIAGFPLLCGILGLCLWQRKLNSKEEKLEAKKYRN
jgi:hypothetical protein